MNKICKKCNLIENNKYNGIDYGNPESECVILRPFPSTSECNSGQYKGRLNNFLIKELTGVKLTKDDYLITSLVNCHPHSSIMRSHIDTCQPRLQDVIKKPAVVIMTLGVDTFNFITGYNLRDVDAVMGTVLQFKDFVLIPNYTVGQAMKNYDMADAFIRQLYKLRTEMQIRISTDIGG